MAARPIRKENWRFYVYEIIDGLNNVIYVGKGSANRIKVSMRERNGCDCREVARFRRERDAYSYEIERISQYDNLLNDVSRGGIGGYATPIRKTTPKKSKDELLMDSIGTRAFCARLLIGYYKAFKIIESKVDDARNSLYNDALRHQLNSIDIAGLYEVAYGSR